MIRNKYKNKCVICNAVCESGIGWCIKSNNKWNVYCDEHTPKFQKIEVERKITKEGNIYTPYEPENLPLLRSFPGAKWDAFNKCWNFSLNQADRYRVLELAIKLNLKIDKELLNIEVSEQAKNSSNDGLYEYQILGVNWLSQGNKRLLADEQGTGKTIQVLKSIPKNGKAIVVCPAAVKYNWKEECQKWRKDLNPIVITGNNSFVFPKEGEVVIINYDIIPDEFECIPDENKKWEFIVNVDQTIKNKLKDCIFVADEAQKVKNIKTNRSKKVKGLSFLCDKIWGLTGTPLLNRPQDLYGVLDSLNMQYEVFRGWKNFTKLMNGVKNRWGGYSWGLPDPSVPELMKRVMLRRLRKDVLPDLPDKTYTTITVDLPSYLKSQCDELWEEFKDMIEGSLSKKESPLPPFERFSALRASLAESRIDCLEEIVEEHEENEIPLVVFSAHKKPIEVIGKRKNWGCITGDTSQVKRQEIVNDFQAGKLIGIASTIKAGGVGLTMTKAWKSIFVDLDWVPGENKQAEDRIARIGQKNNKVEIVQLVSDHVLDKHVLKLLNWKTELAFASIDKSMDAKINSPQFVYNVEEPIIPIVKKEIIEKADKEIILWKGKIELDCDIPF